MWSNITMDRYYKLNPNSPFFGEMQDASIEELLPDNEKQALFKTIISGVVFTQLECFDLTDDEIQFVIYANLNKKSPAETTDILIKNRLTNLNIKL
jgi:hypothetical protein